MLKKDQKVSYTGSNRPYLKNTNGTVKEVRQDGTSALIEFVQKDVLHPRRFNEWVGAGALKVEASTKYSGILSSLKARRTELGERVTELGERITALTEEVNTLSDELYAVDAALKALTALETL